VPITFTATASGTQPIDFEWNFGDMFKATGTMVSHAYPEAGTYTVELTATNACGEDFVSQNITILQKLLEFFLPLLTR
jgi:PKD repeat protein